MVNFRSKLLIIIKRANRCESSRRGLEDVRGPRLRCGGVEGRRGTAQVAARIDRPGCALQCRRRDQATHLLAEHHDTVWIERLKSIVCCTKICHRFVLYVVISDDDCSSHAASRVRYSWNSIIYWLLTFIIETRVVCFHCIFYCWYFYETARTAAYTTFLCYSN